MLGAERSLPCKAALHAIHGQRPVECQGIHKNNTFFFQVRKKPSQLAYVLDGLLNGVRENQIDN